MFLLTKSLGISAATVIGVVVLGAGGYALNSTAADRLAATMTKQVAPLLPNGSVEYTEVTDSPALLARNRRRVQQTTVDGETADGHPVFMIVREFDRDSGRAQSVSWQVEGLPLAPGWIGQRDGNGAYLNIADRQVDGHSVQVTATATLLGTTAVVSVGELTIDGTSTALADAPVAIQQALTPVSFTVPVPDAGNSVRSLWFDERGVGVELYARDVATRK